MTVGAVVNPSRQRLLVTKVPPQKLWSDLVVLPSGGKASKEKKEH